MKYIPIVILFCFSISAMSQNTPRTLVFKVRKPVVVEQDEEDEDEPVFFIVEEMPIYTGGDEAIRLYIAENISIPDSIAKMQLAGRAYVQFIIDITGSVTNVKIARSCGFLSLDKVALDVVKSLPSWKPGKLRGRPVRVSYTVPVNFGEPQ